MLNSERPFYVRWHLRDGFWAVSTIFILLLGTSVANAADTALASHRFDSATTEANAGVSGGFTISDGGRYTAYSGGSSTDIVSGSNTTPGGLYLHDRITNANVLVNHAPGSADVIAPGSFAAWAGISGNGRYVLYHDFAAGLVTGNQDSNGTADVFLYDQVTGLNTLVSHVHSSSTTAANGMSSIAGGDWQRTGSPISLDGRYSVYFSEATDIVAGVVPPSSRSMIFLYDRETGENRLISHVPGSPQLAMGCLSDRLPAISANGDFVAFSGCTTDQAGSVTFTIGDLFLFDRVNGTVRLVTHAPDSNNQGVGEVSGAELLSFSADGRSLVYISSGPILGPGVSDFAHVYLYDQVLDRNILVSDSAVRNGEGADASSFSASISIDGSAVAFMSPASNLMSGLVIHSGIDSPNVYVYERLKNRVTLVSHLPGKLRETGNASSYAPSLSSDGKVVAYVSDASDLVSGLSGPDVQSIYRTDRQTSGTALVSHAAGQVLEKADGLSYGPVLNGVGDALVFRSVANNLVNGQSPSSQVINLFSSIASLAAERDVLPDSIVFANLTGAALNVPAESNAVTISGLDVPARIGVADGEYSVDGGPYTTFDGLVNNGQNVRVRHQTASSYSTSRSSMLYVGDASASFVSTTMNDPSSPGAGNDGGGGSGGCSIGGVSDGTDPLLPLLVLLALVALVTRRQIRGAY